jgi:single-strand DNA-binding protein
MTDFISLTGLVATTPRHLTTSEGLAITSFRLASSQRRFDRATQKWVDGDTNWYTVSAFRGLASNAAGSLSKGERVIVTGRLRIRDWENTDRSGTTVEIEADSLGHDLTWGTSVYTRTPTIAVESGVEEDGWALAGAGPEDEDAPIAAKARKAA